MTMLTTLLQADSTTIRQIATRVVDIASNTTPSVWDIVLGIATVASAVFGALVFYSIKLEFDKNRLSLGCQSSILQDLFRHLYRNKVVLMAMLRDWKEKGYDNVRPSEDILLKTQTLPEDLNFSRFAISNDCYPRMHEIELLLRNYNVVAQTAAEHLKDRNIPIEIKLAEVDQLERRSAGVQEKIAALCPVMGIICEGSSAPVKKLLFGNKFSIISGWKLSQFYHEGLTEAEVMELDIAQWREANFNVFLPYSGQ